MPVSADELHVTLKFLGDTPCDLLKAIQFQIEQSVAGQPPCVLRVERLGAFPHAGHPSVLWAGLEDAEPLVEISKKLDDALEPLGFARESRPFHPHLTLARIKGRPPRELFELLRQHAETKFGTAEILAVELIKSDLGQRDGTRYTTLSVIELKPS